MNVRMKIGIATVAYGALIASAGAAPIDLPSGASVDFKYTGFTAERLTPLPPGATFGNSLAADGFYYETTFGGGYLNQIIDDKNPTTTYWSSGQNNQTVSFFLYGIADKSSAPNGTGFNLNNIGCTAPADGCDGKIHIDFYLDKTTATGGTNPNFLGSTPPVVKPTDRTGFSTLPGITDGSLLMSWVLTPGASPTDPLATLFQSVLSLNLPTNGLGDFLANCVSGPECALFNTAAIPNPTTGVKANFFGQFTLQTPPPGTVTNGWQGLISDPVLTSTAVPEPATLTLFGAGLLALGSLRLRKRNRKD
jgi:hypothetical protein